MGPVSGVIWGFDLDGTISAHPERLGVLMRELRTLGHRVCVITGCLSSSITSPEQRQRQMAELNPPVLHQTHYDELLVVCAPTTDEVAVGKGKLCRERGVDFMLDDTESWMPLIRKESPSTICLRVCP